MAKKIEMNVLNGSGQYETVYPQTLDEQVVLGNGMTLKDWHTAQASGYCFINLLVRNNQGQGVPDITVTGVYESDGVTPVVTDSNGRAVGFGYASETYTVSVPAYTDYSNQKITHTQVTYVLGSYNIELNYGDKLGYATITTSKQVSFSPHLTKLNATLVGGGGGGQNYNGFNNGRGGGGAGGYVTIQENIPFQKHVKYDVIIASGGSAGTAKHPSGNSSQAVAYGGTGGTTTYQGISAIGGAGGPSKGDDPAIGNGNGGTPDGTLPTAGTVAGYLTDTTTLLYGGGGGAGTTSSNGNRAGAGQGGQGALAYSSETGSKDAPAPPANRGGGGGGGAYWSGSEGTREKKCANGSAGCVVFRFVH